MFFNVYPYTNFHELNLDEILRLMRELHHEWDEFTAVNKITNAGAWDITKQYQAWTVVSDNNIGYISLKPVPVGVAITNTEYWGVIADYNILITNLSDRISALENKSANLKIINVLDYGAKGDGVTDDTASINGAIAAATSEGAIVYVPAGRYLISDTINIQISNNTNIMFFGAGYGKTVLIRSSQFTSGSLIKSENSGFTIIKDMRIENGGDQSFNAMGYAIEISSRCIVENVYITNGLGGVAVDSNEVRLVNVTYVDEYTYSANYQAEAGLKIGMTYPVSGFTAVDCSFLNQDVNSANPLSYGVLIRGADGLQFNNCMISGARGVRLDSATVHIDDVYLNNCIIDNCIYNCISMGGSGPVKRNVRFSDCHINGTTAGDMIEIANFSHIQLLGCNLQLGYGNTIVMSGAKDVMITNNIFSENEIANIPNLHEIRGSCDVIVINGNLFDSDNATVDVDASNLTDSLVVGNSFKHGIYGTPTEAAGNLTR